MAKYSVPNAPAVPYLDQAEPDDFDYQALGFRRTGIIRGGDVTALGTPGPSVKVAAGVAVIVDVPIRFAAGTVGVAGGGGNPRFDIIAVDRTGVLVNIPGAESANALFANFDFTNYAPLAVVYVPQGTTSVLGSNITAKAATMPAAFIRTYDAAGAMVVRSDVLGASLFTLYANGTHTWGTSTLTRTSDVALTWATGLTLKGLANNQLNAVFILQAIGLVPEGETLLQVLGKGGNPLASINGAGQLFADNIKSGTEVNPNTVVVGKRGDIYISRVNGGTSLGIWQKGGSDGTKTGWASYRVYDPAESSLPTGTIIQSLAPTAPTGFIAANGQMISTTGATADLAALIGSRYGSQPGSIQMPDLRGRTLAGAGGGLSAFTSIGTDEVSLSVANLPPHSHNVNDPGHDHPEAGPHAYVMPWQAHNNRHIVPSSGSYEHIYTESYDFNRNARTGITLGNTGSASPVPVYQPTHVVNLYVKL